MDVNSTELDLFDTSLFPPNYQWDCEVTLDESDSPAYEQVYCTRTVASATVFDTLAIKYFTGYIYFAFGYKYDVEVSSSGSTTWTG